MLSFIKLPIFFENDQTMSGGILLSNQRTPHGNLFRQSRDLEAILVDVHVSFPLAICKHIIIRGFYRI